MRIKETSSGSGPVTVIMMEQNLRLPTGFDTALLTRLIKSATDYVERVTNIAVRAKTINASFIGPRRIYDLKYLVNAVTEVKVDGEEIVSTEYEVFNNANPGYLRFKTLEIEEDAIVEISYTVTATTDNESINEAIIVYATAMYNNPEGLGQMDMRRINALLTTISQ